MAKHKGRKRGNRFANYIKGNIDVDIALGTLASKTAIIGAVGDTVNDTARVSSVRATYSLSGFTAIENAGPILVGLMHSDYSGAELEEFLENVTNWSMGDLVSQEVANRKIRRIGAFTVPASAGQAVHLNDGKPITTKLNWKLSEGQTLDFWAYNMGSQPLATTDPNVDVSGFANLWFV